jgi:hypothetical protein
MRTRARNPKESIGRPLLVSEQCAQPLPLLHNGTAVFFVAVTPEPYINFRYTLEFGCGNLGYTQTLAGHCKWANAESW